LRAVAPIANARASKIAVLPGATDLADGLLHLIMRVPTNVQLIGEEVAIAWDDGVESYLGFEKLRAASPSASNVGERDILGNQYGGDGPKKFPGVQVIGWERVGNYALRFDFSDGHRTGLYSFDYLRQLAGS
jgi:DUF971 family protein